MAASRTAIALFARKRRSRPPAPIVIRRPAPMVGGRGRVRAALSRIGTAARTQAVEEKVMVRALGGAAVLGAAERFGFAANIPVVAQLGLAGTVGAAAFALGKVTKSRLLVDASIGPLCIALRDLIKGEGGEAASGDSGTL